MADRLEQEAIEKKATECVCERLRACGGNVEIAVRSVQNLLEESERSAWIRHGVQEAAWRRAIAMLRDHDLDVRELCGD